MGLVKRFGSGVLVSLALAGCSESATVDQPAAVCGNAVCEAGEATSCPSDCCPDGGCDPCADGGCAQCGNGELDFGEQCDGTALGGATCATEGHSAGNLTCTAQCKLDTSGCCADACPEGGTRCNGSVRESCNPGASGCREWVANADCADLGDFVCDESSGAAKCVPSCTDQCSPQGSAQCNANLIESCETGANGCLSWSMQIDCGASGQTCSATGGQPACINSCTNQCTTLGTTQCSGNVVQTCTTGAGGCLVWTTTTDCTATSQVCTPTTGGATCTTQCTGQCSTAGQQTCIGGVVNTCTMVGGCLTWSATQSCVSQPGYICQVSGTTASCVPQCTGDQCTTEGATQCNNNTIRTCTKQPNTCLNWQVTTTCPLGQTCSASSGTPSCVTAPPTGEDCGTAIQILPGANSINWTATAQNHLTVKPICIGTYSLTGPDVVLYYTATITGTVELTITKPASNRLVLVASDAACGTTSPQLACISDYSPTTITGTFPVTAGTTYYMYVSDTTNGTGTLPNPLSINVKEIDCSTFAGTVTSVTPISGTTLTTLWPTLTINFDTAVKTNVGIITLTGNKGTTLSYDLSKIPFPSQVVFSNLNKTITIDPGIAFPADELVTVSWTGIVDTLCSKPVAAPAWSFSTAAAPCSPATNGMIGTTQTALPLGTSFISEYFAAVDTDPNGWAYIGGTSYLYRVKKAGGGLENLVTNASVSTAQLGYQMLTEGPSVFLVENKVGGTNGHFWRITANAGVTWSVQDFVSFPTAPTYGFKGAASYKGKIYLLTSGTSTLTAQQIWSLDANPATVPAIATLETTFSGEAYPTALALDDNYYYVASGSPARVVRVSRTNGQTSVITTGGDMNTLATALFAHDTNNDGTADYLYFKGSYEQVWFTCNPSSATPYTDRLLKYGTGTGAYGMGFDPVAKKLYAYDDSAYGFVVIQ